MSCSHLLVGLPLPLLPSILASKMCLSCLSWLLMWPKYLSFSVFAFCRSIVVFISNLESTSLLVTFPSRIFSRFFYNISFQKMLSFLHLCCLWSMLGRLCAQKLDSCEILPFLYNLWSKFKKLNSFFMRQVWRQTSTIGVFQSSLFLVLQMSSIFVSLLSLRLTSADCPCMFVSVISFHCFVSVVFSS